MASLIDFDATLAQADGEEEASATFDFKFLGKTWPLPVSPPAKGMLKVRRLYMLTSELQMRQATGNITEAEANKLIEVTEGADLETMLTLLIGAGTVQAWLQHDMTDDQLKRVFTYLWRRYNGQEDGEGEAQPPANRGARRAKPKSAGTRSSSTGASSRRTGSGSTTKTSRKR